MIASPKGLSCPQCGNAETGVTDSRPDAIGRYIRRRRRCQCGERFTTMEIVVPKGSRALVMRRDAMAASLWDEISARMPGLLATAVNRAWPVEADDDDD